MLQVPGPKILWALGVLARPGGRTRARSPRAAEAAGPPGDDKTDAGDRPCPALDPASAAELEGSTLALLGISCGGMGNLRRKVCTAMNSTQQAPPAIPQSITKVNAYRAYDKKGTAREFISNQITTDFPGSSSTPTWRKYIVRRVHA